MKTIGMHLAKDSWIAALLMLCGGIILRSAFICELWWIGYFLSLTWCLGIFIFMDRCIVNFKEFCEEQMRYRNFKIKQNAINGVEMIKDLRTVRYPLFLMGILIFFVEGSKDAFECLGIFLKSLF